MPTTSRSQWNLAATLLLLAAGCTHAAAGSDTCPASAELAVSLFMESALDGEGRAATLLQPQALGRFRARLEQLLDNRYSPDSAGLRERMLGAEWTLPRLRTASDAELVGRYLASGQQRRAGASITDLKLLRREPAGAGGERITVSYQVHGVGPSATQERTFSAAPSGGCWKLDVPVEAWARLDRVASILKAARPTTDLPREGPARACLHVAPASSGPRPGAQPIPLPAAGGAARKVWVDQAALLTQEDIQATSASWDCDAGPGPEAAAVRIVFNDRAADTLVAWSERNVGAMLAVVVNGEALVFAKVAGRMDAKLSVCLPEDAPLEEAQALARDLRGAK